LFITTTDTFPSGLIKATESSWLLKNAYSSAIFRQHETQNRNQDDSLDLRWPLPSTAVQT